MPNTRLLHLVQSVFAALNTDLLAHSRELQVPQMFHVQDETPANLAKRKCQPLPFHSPRHIQSNVQIDWRNRALNLLEMIPEAYKQSYHLSKEGKAHLVWAERSLEHLADLHPTLNKLNVVAWLSPNFEFAIELTLSSWFYLWIGSTIFFSQFLALLLGLLPIVSLNALRFFAKLSRFVRQCCAKLVTTSPLKWMPHMSPLTVCICLNGCPNTPIPS